MGYVSILELHDKYQRESILLAIWQGEEHHLHRHEGLPVGLQVLLSCGQKREGMSREAPRSLFMRRQLILCLMLFKLHLNDMCYNMSELLL